MSSKHPKVATFATISAENEQLKKVLPLLQNQARQAMIMAAEEKGKYLHVLKLFAAIVAQNMQMNMPTVVLHKSVVDQPDTINIAREEVDGGYAYRVVSEEEIRELEAVNGDSAEASPTDGNGEVGLGGANEVEEPRRAKRKRIVEAT